GFLVTGHLGLAVLKRRGLDILQYNGEIFGLEDADWQCSLEGDFDQFLSE
ncbi:hypothetical protein F441_00717, partial [Phytophthora nicotianae CJ01A1]